METIMVWGISPEQATKAREITQQGVFNCITVNDFTVTARIASRWQQAKTAAFMRQVGPAKLLGATSKRMN